MSEKPMGFWGLVVEPEKMYSQQVPASFKITMATLGPDAYSKEEDKKSKRIFVMLTHEKNGEFVLCSLSPNEKDNEHLNHVFVEGETIHLRTLGDSNVHLTGYYIDSEDADHDHAMCGLDDEEMEAEELGEDIENTEDEVEEGDSEEDEYETEDDEEEEEEEDEAISLSGDEELDSDEYGVSDDEMPRIREINSEEEEAYSDDDLSEADMTPSDSECLDSEDESEGDEDELEEDEEDASEEEDEDEKIILSNKKRPLPASAQPQKRNKTEQQPESKKKIGITSDVKPDTPPQSKSVTPVKEQQKDLTPNQDGLKGTESPTSTAKILPSGLKIEDVKMGAGIKAQKGRRVGITYTVTDQSGAVLVSNKGKQSLIFNMGEREVMPALSIGVQGMALGGERKITVPATMVELGSQPAIPKKNTCTIHVVLENVQPKAKN